VPEPPAKIIPLRSFSIFFSISRLNTSGFDDYYSKPRYR
jgi:hypothetical protein